MQEQELGTGQMKCRMMVPAGEEELRDRSDVAQMEGEGVSKRMTYRTIVPAAGAEELQSGTADLRKAPLGSAPLEAVDSLGVRIL